MREKEFLDALEEDTRRQCDEILENAQKEAEAIITGLEKEWEGLKKSGFEKVDAFLQRERIRKLTRARLSAREVILKEKRLAIVRVFEEVHARFKDLRKDENYPEMLERLYREALDRWDTYMKNKKPIVVVSGRDREVLKSLIPSPKREIISDDTGDMSPGVIIMSEDGRYKMVNTLQSRLERTKPEIEYIIDRMLFGVST